MNTSGSITVRASEGTTLSFPVGERLVYLRGGERVTITGTTEEVLGLARRLQHVAGVEIVRQRLRYG